jgi:phosphoribosyl-dephospho-CoA transferase
MMNRFRPHDILRIDPARIAKVLELEDSFCWTMAEESLWKAPFVVVRRADDKSGLIPVGIRGADRSQRFAAWLDLRGVCQRIEPESLRTSAEIHGMPAIAILRALQDRWASLAFPWGPTGGIGFELASGVRTVTETSDLDLLIRSEERITYNSLRRLADSASDFEGALDMQIETPHGGFALQEFLSSRGTVLLRTSTGPALVEDPWSMPMPREIPA